MGRCLQTINPFSLKHSLTLPVREDPAPRLIAGCKGLGGDFWRSKLAAVSTSIVGTLPMARLGATATSSMTGRPQKSGAFLVKSERGTRQQLAARCAAATIHNLATPSSAGNCCSGVVRVARQPHGLMRHATSRHLERACFDRAP